MPGVNNCKGKTLAGDIGLYRHTLANVKTLKGTDTFRAQTLAKGKHLSGSYISITHARNKILARI